MTGPQPAPDDGLRAPLAEFLTRLGAAAQVDDAAMDGAMRLTSLGLDLPVELDVGTDADGALRVRACPPTQRVATTFLPVFHRMTVRITGEEHHDAR
ncbi:hypothetical protein ABZ916_23895 [Streptomyces sp. NPDC046853]|uniref:hypothetical protein n=1 Tax=Streptomyces sp. NPDC046853 TaxID=3154920 RepID=UPI003407D2D9